MRFRLPILSLLLCAALPLPLRADQEPEPETTPPKPELEISEIMIQAHKEGLLKRVTAGSGTQAEKEQLLGYYKMLALHVPPKGSSLDWKERTGKLVEGAKSAVAGEPNADRALKRIVNCRDCHTFHKPE